MALFQKTVEHKYLKQLDEATKTLKHKDFTKNSVKNLTEKVIMKFKQSLH
jgi:hypothetical protein